MRRNLDAYRNYVCPECFRQLNKCECDYFPPYSLLFIDVNIQDQIRNLNKKGYRTSGCCEGHFQSYSVEPYVTFIKDYHFNKMPDGFSYKKSKNGVIAKTIHTKNKEEYDTLKRELLNNLSEWVEELPENNCR